MKFTETKTFLDAREFFERTAAKTYPITLDLTREGKDAPAGCFYRSGVTNLVFAGFLSGRSYGELDARLATCDPA